jgi:hypothetical protein
MAARPGTSRGKIDGPEWEEIDRAIYDLSRVRGLKEDDELGRRQAVAFLDGWGNPEGDAKPNVPRIRQVAQELRDAASIASSLQRDKLDEQKEYIARAYPRLPRNKWAAVLRSDLERRLNPHTRTVGTELVELPDGSFREVRHAPTRIAGMYAQLAAWIAQRVHIQICANDECHAVFSPGNKRLKAYCSQTCSNRGYYLGKRVLEK